MLLAVHTENKAKHINVCGREAKFVMLKQIVRATTTELQKVTIYIQGVPGGRDKTSGECSLC